MFNNYGVGVAHYNVFIGCIVTIEPYTAVHNAVMIRILMLTNSYNAELLKD